MTTNLKRLQNQLAEPLLVAKKENLLYLTGRSFIDGYLLVFPKKNPVYLGNGLESFKDIKSDYIFKVGKYIKTGTLNVENSLSLKEFHYFKRKLKGVKLTPVEGQVEQLRIIKSKRELELLEQSYKITALIFANAKRMLKKQQWTEKGLATYIRIWGLEFGADEVSFDPIVASGSNAAIPHHLPTDRIIKSGETVVLDFGFKVAGYCSDFTRTVFLKKAPPKLARIYIETEKAYRQAFNHIRAGMTGAMGDALGRDVLREANLEEYFIHSLGHSTGLEVHERPNLTPGEEAVLENSMVFSIEPGVYVPKLGGVRIEDLVYLKNGRPHYFVSVPTALKDMII